MAETMAAQYEKAMENHSFGRALFRPAPLNVLKPGCCGYIDDQGRWNPILADIQAPSAANFTASAPLDPMKPQYLVWGPKTSTDMSHRSVAFNAAADALAAGFPAEVKLAMDFSTTKDFGAVLHCSGEVQERGFYHRHPFVSWAKANAGAILKACPDVKDQGVWVVMSTCETQKADINAWTGAQKTVSMGFTVGVPAAGEIGPSGEFVRNQSASGWNHYEEKQDRLVVFFTGVYLRYSYLVFGIKSLREVRGDEDETIVVRDPEDTDDCYTVEMEIVGGKDLN